MDKQLIFQLLMMGATLWLVFLIYLHIQTEVRNGKSIKRSTKEGAK